MGVLYFMFNHSFITTTYNFVIYSMEKYFPNLQAKEHLLEWLIQAFHNYLISPAN